MHASTSQSSPAFPADVLVNRRRPGRAPADPALVPLLRQPASPEFASDKPFLDDAEQANSMSDDDDERRLIRGIGFGLLLSAPFWIAVAALGRSLFR